MNIVLHQVYLVGTYAYAHFSQDKQDSTSKLDFHGITWIYTGHIFMKSDGHIQDIYEMEQSINSFIN